MSSEAENTPCGDAGGVDGIARLGNACATWESAHHISDYSSSPRFRAPRSELDGPAPLRLPFLTL